MLINLLAVNNYNSYNIEIAKLIGLHEAIYLNEVINIQEKAYRKNKIDNGYITLDRKYIESRTTLKEDEQKDLQKPFELSKIIIADPNNSNKVYLDLEVLINLLNEGNEVILKNFGKDLKKNRKQIKSEAIRVQLKKNIITQNQELYNAYCEWIDSVSNKRGYMDKKAVVEGQKVIDNYCNRNLDMALKIISIATINSYVDMNWAVNVFKKECPKTFTDVPTIQNISQLSTEAF